MAIPEPDAHPAGPHMALTNIVFQAGHDCHRRPIFVFCPSRLPPKAAATGFDELVRLALAKLSPTTVLGPYQFVLFATPTADAPTLKQLLDAYTLVDHRARKNLATLFVVHPSFWTRLTAQVLLKTVVSGKMAMKVRWIPSLSALAAELPIHQICIPPDVYKFNLTIEQAIQVPPESRQQPVFEAPLTLLTGPAAEHGIPRVVQDCAACIRSSGLTAEGIFRRPPSLTTVRHLRAVYDRGHPVLLAEYDDAPFLAAALLKLFLRLLPDPIVDSSLYDAIRACPKVENGAASNNAEAVEHVARQVLGKMEPRPARALLVYVLALLHDVSLHSAHNKMDALNLATCIAPTMVRSDDVLADTAMCRVSGEQMSFGTVLRLMIDRFPDVSKTLEQSPACHPPSPPAQPPPARYPSPHALGRACEGQVGYRGTGGMGVRMGSGVVALTGVCGVNVFGMIGRVLSSDGATGGFGKGGAWPTGGSGVGQLLTVPVDGNGGGCAEADDVD